MSHQTVEITLYLVLRPQTGAIHAEQLIVPYKSQMVELLLVQDNVYHTRAIESSFQCH